MCYFDDFFETLLFTQITSCAFTSRRDFSDTGGDSECTPTVFPGPGME